MSEQRIHSRKALETEASIADISGNLWSSAHLLDISEGGAALMCKEELMAGSSRMLRFCLPEKTEPVKVIATVVHCVRHSYLDEEYRIGVRFWRLNDPRSIS